jgi:glycosyltransferase involved in cell wall biosynthesis
VLYVGTKSFQKGLIDLARIADGLGERFELRLVGPEEPHAGRLLQELKTKAQVLPPVPQAELPAVYEWAAVFVFPTLQDGFPVVLAQAQASGLPILATANCSAPELVHDGETGWILPIRSAAAFMQRLEWCDNHRAELARMVTRIYDEFKSRTWDDVARDYEVAILKRSRLAESERGVTCGR